jgi:hypothetical protein
LSVKKTIIAAALVLSLAIVACDDGGDATEAPAVEPVATEAVEAVESMAAEAEEAVESMAAEVEEPVESVAAEVEEVVEDAVESPAA